MKKSALLFFAAFIALTAFCPSGQKEPVVLISTSYGDIKIKLYEGTPMHRDNFIKLAEEDYYQGVLFHRVIKNFMIQAGDPDSKGAKPGKALGDGGPGYTVPAEINKQYYHKKGALAAARLGDDINPSRASSGSQFYIVQGRKYRREDLEKLSKKTGMTYTEEQIETYLNEGGTPHLDGSYTVFGEVIEGMDVVDEIASVKTGKRDRPLTDVVIKDVKVLKE